MTDEELQSYADANVRVTLGGRMLQGKLITGFAAQIGVNAPYAIQWYDVNTTSGTTEERVVAIPSAEAVEAIEFVDETGSCRDRRRSRGRTDARLTHSRVLARGAQPEAKRLAREIKAVADRALVAFLQQHLGKPRRAGERRERIAKRVGRRSR